MFILYAIPLGILVGLARGGRLGNLAELRFAWGWLALTGLAAQVVLFTEPVGAVVGGAGPILYVASSLLVLAVVLRNRTLPGLKLVAVGAISNLVAIVTNGGYMPADPGALARAGLDPTSGYSNSIVTNRPAFPGLTDIFAMPDWMPFANVFSIGDVLIGIGIVVAIAAGMAPRPASEGVAKGTTNGPTAVSDGASPD
ncbi:MAG: DUF5317 domain-containing protein [Chloroflexota bacterium]|nr:DUF5317 domain-containing protein [Chloroflexota bacterium]